jgi:hypothetical protein
MTTEQELVPVTQADRDAAADFYGPYLARPGEVPVTAHMRAGKVDESPLVQAFARHRLSSQQDREAVLEEAARVVDRGGFGWEEGDLPSTYRRRIAEAIRALKTTPPSTVEGSGPASPTMDEIVEVPTGDLREYARFVADLPCETKGAEDLEPGCCLPCRARSLLSRLKEQG